MSAFELIKKICLPGSVPGLDLICELLALLGNPEKKLKYVHIAGTNGKGSTAAMIESVLRTSGYRTGLFTSPFIHSPNEQIKLNGQDISEADFSEIAEYIATTVGTMENAPTEFEILCCAAFEFFARQNCDIVILEAGMGGKGDATNVIPSPEVAVITNIGLDHTEYLGSTVSEIARAKSGIIKESCRAVIYPSTPEVEAVFRDACLDTNSTLHIADFSALIPRTRSIEGQVFDFGKLKNLFLPLLGEHQLKNAAVALTAISELAASGWNITDNSIARGLAKTAWEGRFEIASHNPLFIIDGGHNPQCIEALAQNIKDYISDKKIIALTGVLADKDYAEMYAPVMKYISEFVCITPPNPRKLEAKALAEFLRAKGATAAAADTIREGVKLACGLAKDDVAVLCFGSLYSIGEIKKALKSKEIFSK